MTTAPQRSTLARTATIALASAALVSAIATAASATIVPGTAGKDVTIGLDNDNATNTFIQPPGVAAKQHMEGTDVLFGRDNDDLLIGKLGSDTALGGKGADILVGGPEGFATPNSDVLIGDEGDDINIWAPGDGSDAFIGNSGHDTMVFAPFVTNPNGSLKLETKLGRQVPRVNIGGLPGLSCTIVKVPAAQRLGAQFLVRFNVNGTPVVTVRQTDVERVYCPSPNPGQALVADLTAAHPSFAPVWLNQIPGVVGAILAQP